MERARKHFTEFLQFNVDGLQGRGFLKGLELAWGVYYWLTKITQCLDEIDYKKIFFYAQSRSPPKELEKARVVGCTFQFIYIL